MIHKDIAKAYQLVVENKAIDKVSDEDEETSSKAILSTIADGLRDILDKIEAHMGKSAGPKTLKIPENPEDTSWIPSAR